MNMSRISVYPAAEPLGDLVRGYWFVEDWNGVHDGRPIVTGPRSTSIITINFGRPNAMVDGPVAPRVSLIGPQTGVRHWRSWPETYFVMAMLTPCGVARLFPGTGRAAANSLVDLAVITGQRYADVIANGLDPRWPWQRIAAELDRRLIERMDGVSAPDHFVDFAVAYALLRSGHQVNAVASHLGTGRRQLHRWFHDNVGIGPKQLMDLERLQRSLAAVQERRGDPLEGYSDQAHQIRNWRRRLDVTPGTYVQSALSRMPTFLAGASVAAEPFYL
jgi:AraC-like DNA-binding protein